MRTPWIALVTLAFACTHSPAQRTEAPPGSPEPAAPPAQASPAPPAEATASKEEAFAKARQGAMALMRDKDAARALALFEEARAMGLEHPEVSLFAARAAATLGKTEEGAKWLVHALQPGEESVLLADDVRFDPALRTLADHPSVKPLLAKLDEQAAAALAKANPGAGLPRSAPEAEGIDPEALAKMLAAAEAAHSSALVVLRDGKLAGEWYFGRTRAPVEAMSATKSVTSLAVGLLLRDGKLRSIDEPISTWFPQWSEGDKAKVTVRHLLNHTSGLVADRTTERIYASPDFVQHALNSEVKAPGTDFFYNNSATNLLAGVVGKVAGKRMDEYLAEKLFTPMGITDFSWTLDRAGNPHGMSGLQIHPADFAKLGQLMLQGGRWNGQQLLDEAWVKQSVQPSQPFNPTCGLLWWLHAESAAYEWDDAFFHQMGDKGVDPAMVEKLAPLRGKRLDRGAMMSELTRLLGDDGTSLFQVALAGAGVRLRQTVQGPYDAYAAMGFLGQYLMVFPQEKLVVVRMARSTQEVPHHVVEFPEFVSHARKLVPDAAPRSTKKKKKKK